MRPMQRILVSSFLSGLMLLAAGPVAASTPLPDPVRTAILEAINTNPEVQERWHAFLAAEEGRKVARGRYFPEIDIQLSAARQYQESSAEGRVSRDPLNASVTLNQMLYDGFFTRSDVARLGHAKMVRYYEFVEAAEQAALDAIRAYADVERHRELVLLAEENHDAHRRLYDQVLELTETGVGRGVDLEQATGRVALAESNLLTEISNLHDVSARFLRVVGRVPSDDYVDLIGTLPTELIPATVTEVQIDALATNPALFAATENILSAQQQVRVGRSYNHPRLDLQVRHGRNNALQTVFIDDGERWTTDTSIGLVLNFNLFRGLADQARIGQFVEEANVARDTREVVCRNVRQEVTIAFNDVAVLDEQLTYLDQHQLSMDRVRTAYLQQFGIGQRNLLDLLDTENEYFQARRAFVNGQFDREFATARTLAGQGRLLQALDVMRDEMPEIATVTTLDPAAICPPIPVTNAQRAMAPVPAPQFTTTTLGADTLFDFDSATLRPEGRATLRGLAAELTAADATYTSVLVEGHTCTIGPAAYNQDLSTRRAQSVVDYFVEQGVRRDAIRMVGHGEDRPAADNTTREGRIQNRRVEVTTDLRTGARTVRAE